MRKGYIIDVVEKILFLNDIHTNRGCVKIDTSSLPVTLIWVLEHTLVWVSVNYIYSYRLAVLILYILFSIAIVACVFVPGLLFFLF